MPSGSLLPRSEVSATEFAWNRSAIESLLERADCGHSGKSSVQSGLARGVEGARALAAALAQLPLQVLELGLGRNELGRGPRRGKGPGPGPRGSEPGLCFRVFPQELDTQKVRVAVPPLKNSPISCDSHLTWKLGVLDGPLCKSFSVRPKFCSRVSGVRGGGWGSRIVLAGFGGSEERRPPDVRCRYPAHFRTVTFESAYDVSFAHSLCVCANSCNFSCDASAKPVAKTCCACPRCSELLQTVHE